MKLFLLPPVNSANFVYRSVMGPFMSDGVDINGVPSIGNSLIYEAENRNPQHPDIRVGRFNSLNPIFRDMVVKRLNDSSFQLINERNNICIAYNQLRNSFERKPCDTMESQLFNEVPFKTEPIENTPLQPTKEASFKTNTLPNKDALLFNETNAPLNDILKVKKINEAGEGILLNLEDKHLHDTLSDQINDLNILKEAYNDK